MPTRAAPEGARGPRPARAFACLPWLLSAAVVAHEGEEGGAAGATGDWWAGPPISGSWYAPDRAGEGIILEVLPDGSVVAFWFTYPAAGEAGEQAWMIAPNGVVDGNQVRFETVYRPIGARFGDDFDPADVESTQWGSMELHFDDCNAATVHYQGPPAYGSGSRELVRLTAIAEAGCSGTRTLLPSGARAQAGLRGKSGAWYVPSRSGEGWIVEEYGNGLAGAYWFTFAPDGTQAWTYGLGVRDGDSIVIDDLQITSGARFGDAFDPAAVRSQPWGRLALHLDDCDHASVDYQSGLPGYGAASRAAERLARIAGATCVDAFPQSAPTGAWSTHAGVPAPWQSEHDVAVLGGQAYVLGGFGDPRGFKRFDPAANRWTVLPQLPAGRDHAAAFGLDGGVYLVGGAPNGGGDQSHAAFRFDVQQSRWEPVPELASVFGSRAAVLHGRAYVGNASGTLQEYDPRTRRVRLIEDADGPHRDHAQVVAFLDEIWMMGGRRPDTATVVIYDPISGTWRNGPSLQRRRGGFAAATVGNRLLVTGGEVVHTGVYLEGSTESIGAGQEHWAFSTPLPQALHGTAGAGLGGRFYVFGGSTIVGSSAGQTAQVLSLPVPP